ncbi:phosphoglycerate kinase [candidate division WWE3 bacterium]|jgi:phosphoglycerate kinase|uniref:Phosphoglycerate kinase n=1 Tax=candidate division WWE3 bacterium TaxID=2053526 RepID=A0A3A4ZK30_UNCKA|nr:MAG: phosphoglycerate kinase [candidate division WWE3 bacterium]
MKSIKDAPIQIGTRVFVAADLDVPIENGVIKETYRLEGLLPTTKFIVEKGGIPIFGGHMGSPHGKVDDILSTRHLKSFFDTQLGTSGYVLLENLRFDIREENNDEQYARELADKADIYVNENFSTSHRRHASIAQLPKILPAFAGFRLESEIQHLTKILDSPEKPFVVVIGGAKLESKKPTVSKFIQLADYVLIGGKIGLDWTDEIPQNLILPLDYAENQLDIGPETVRKYVDIISTAKTVLWAGPMGFYEKDKYLLGTKSIAEAITGNPNCFSLIGGGDTVAAANRVGLLEKFSFVSTGGGSMLEFLVKKTLPGIEALG